ncbi:MAG TPA: DUF1887 family CARF protein [Syntrophorhabdaceae bacterium]|nr:DUF1887 family CARF protein [Syntrophorhabdaceae bacterium]
MSRIHVCLVSDQPIPNLIPLRMEEFRPEKVILLVSTDMKLQADRLEKVIKGWAIKVEKIPIDAYDLEFARQTCTKILSRYESTEIILNATGGTKIMAFAAFEVFRELGKTILYVDTRDRWIQVLSPKSQRIDFKGVLKVPTYLNAYGQIILNERTDKDKISQHLPAVTELVKICEEYQDAIKILNGYVAPLRNARTFPLKIEIKKHDYENQSFQKIIELYEKFGILKFDDNVIRLPDLEDVEFISGGWLEEYVFHAVTTLSVTDVRMGVEVKYDTPGSRYPTNEYDVVFTHNNRLFLIECKTKRFEGADRASFNDEPIYKLENLRDAAGGVYGKGMLVSYRSLTEAQKLRLKANRLEFCDALDIKNLSERLIQWIK